MLRRSLLVVVLVGCGRLGFDARDDDANPGEDGAVPGVLGIASPPAGAEVGPTIELTGGCATGALVELGGAGLAAPDSTPCTGGLFAVRTSLTAGFGPKEITVAQGGATIARSFIRVPQQVLPVSAKSGATVSQGTFVDCTLQIDRPPDLAAGDLIVGMIYTDGGFPAAIDTATAGFTRLALDGTTFAAFFKIAGTEPATYDFPITAGTSEDDTCASGGALAVFRNADPAGPIDAQSTFTNGFSTTIVAPSVTAHYPTLLVGVFGSNGPGSGITAPAGMTIDGDPMPDGSSGISPGGFGNALIAWQEVADGPTGPRTATIAMPTGVAGGLIAIVPN